VAGADLLWALSKAAAEVQRSVFVLGGEPGVADDAGGRLRTAFPDLDVRGGYSPPWGFERSEWAMEDVIDALTQAAPDIVFCGLGFPKQERLILELTESFPHVWFIGSGASHVFAAGQLRRAPGWMQHCGLEWCHRLIQEPRRLFRRYLVDDAPFALWLLAGSVLCRCAPKHSVLHGIADRARPGRTQSSLLPDHHGGGSGNGRTGNGTGRMEPGSTGFSGHSWTLPKWTADDNN
jgi:N-acetylglucosaminyldiphosphoundecaprenol N-acetyl-beta-D-mannosaminyltransferase